MQYYELNTYLISGLHFCCIIINLAFFFYVYFKFIFSVSIRILIEIFVFKLNKFSTLSSQYITYSIYYGCFPGIIFTNQHIYAFLKMNF